LKRRRRNVRQTWREEREGEKEKEAAAGLPQAELPLIGLPGPVLLLQRHVLLLVGVGVLLAVVRGIKCIDRCITIFLLHV
jgi:hypothetical protein